MIICINEFEPYAFWDIINKYCLLIHFKFKANQSFIEDMSSLKFQINSKLFTQNLLKVITMGIHLQIQV